MDPLHCEVVLVRVPFLPCLLITIESPNVAKEEYPAAEWALTP